MKWTGRRESGNIEDRRSIPGGRIAVGGGVVGIIILLINLFMGGDPSQVIDVANQMSSQQQSTAPISAEEDEMAKFVSVALADNEDVWHKLFAEKGMTYEEPKVVLFRDAVESGCGNASAASGPFY